MRRKIDERLAAWAQNPKAHPLLVRGARRVGKTYALKTLGTERFGTDNFAYCDFQTDLDQFNRIFAGTTDVERIVSDLSLFLRKDIVAGKTLVVFDEIQLCEKALSSLRYFAESSYRVIASGSQLGFTLHERALPFPSDVDQITLHPLDFEEFLWAFGETRMADGIRTAFGTKEQFLLHGEALARYHQYVVIGGMPSAIKEFVDSQDFGQVRTLQSEINQTYMADIALYAPADSVVSTQAVWASIPKQIARETTGKFKYTDVATGGRERKYRTPLAWLEAAELVSLNYQTNEVEAPLVARNDGSFFKVYLADTGILFFRLNIDAGVYLDDTQRPMLSARFRGALAENYVMGALRANGLETFYWTPGTSSQNEVEFVVQNRRGQVVPIEVKSGDNVASASLNSYRKKSKAPVAVRISARNFGLENGIFSVPLYATFCLDEQSLSNISLTPAG